MQNNYQFILQETAVHMQNMALWYLPQEQQVSAFTTVS
jgi:hypothetical protein